MILSCTKRWAGLSQMEAMMTKRKTRWKVDETRWKTRMDFSPIIQFKIQFKSKSEIFIPKNIHSIESKIFKKIFIQKKRGKLFNIPK